MRASKAGPKNISLVGRFSRIINNMSKRTEKITGRSCTRVLGSKTFAAIAAVEGLRLSATSRKRLAVLKASDLSPEERRAEVLRAYAAPKGRR